jgi:hypothetical protein
MAYFRLPTFIVDLLRPGHSSGGRGRRREGRLPRPRGASSPAPAWRPGGAARDQRKLHTKNFPSKILSHGLDGWRGCARSARVPYQGFPIQDFCNMGWVTRKIVFFGGPRAQFDRLFLSGGATKGRRTVGSVTRFHPVGVATLHRNTCTIARNHHSQIASHECALSRGELDLSWAIMGYF